jgi:hypothetical protein
VARVEESQQREARVAAGLETTRVSYQSRKWRRRVAAAAATASSCWRLGRGVARSGKASRREVRRWASSRATRGAALEQ